VWDQAGGDAPDAANLISLEETMRRLLGRAGVVLVAAALAVVVAAAPAAAHVVANPNEADSRFFHTAFRVGHGCDGSPTTAVRVEIPDGVYFVYPEAVPGWELEVERARFGRFGRVVEVAWVGGPLPSDQVQLFGLWFWISPHAPEVLWFPTVQECEVGERRWVNIPPSLEEWGATEEPAPYVVNAT
jgi:uncharacterized protein YcnI